VVEGRWLESGRMRECLYCAEVVRPKAVAVVMILVPYSKVIEGKRGKER
jgi:hypothetical protein